MVKPSRLASHFAYVAFLALAAFDAPAQVNDVGTGWRPSDWGKDDRLGALNRLTPATTVSAFRLVRDGGVYELAHPLEPGVPAIAGRTFELTINSGGPLGSNQVVYHDDTVVANLGHIGTHLDALGHVGTRVLDRDVYFNGLDASEFATEEGLKELGIATVGPIITRGVLIDVARQKAVDRLEPGHVITAAELREALAGEQVRLHEGDAVLVRTGYGALWMIDNAEYSRNYPGIGAEAAEWLVGQGIVLVGSDNLSVHIRGESPNQPFALHQFFLAHHGVYLLENLNLEHLSADRVHEFAFIFAPLKIKGGTGSPGTPIALR